MSSERIFNLAASSCGYDVKTVVGAAAAREDRRVWDLAERYQAELNDAGNDATDGDAA